MHSTQHCIPSWTSLFQAVLNLFWLVFQNHFPLEHEWSNKVFSEFWLRKRNTDETHLCQSDYVVKFHSYTNFQIKLCSWREVSVAFEKTLRFFLSKKMEHRIVTFSEIECLTQSMFEIFEHSWWYFPHYEWSTSIQWLTTVAFRNCCSLP